MYKERICKYVTWTFFIITFLVFIIGKSGYALFGNVIIPFPNILYLCLHIDLILYCTYLFIFRRKAIKSYFIAIFIYIFLLVSTWFSFFGNEGPIITYLESPDRQHQLAVVESSSMFTSHALIYEKKNFLIMRQIGEISYRDIYRFIADNDYEIAWLKNSLIISVEYSPIHGGDVENHEIFY